MYSIKPMGLLMMLSPLFLNYSGKHTDTNMAILPKVELHLHLDCSLSYEVVQAIDPSVSYEEYRRSFVAQAKCTNLADYIKRSIPPVNLMQTTEQLRLVTLDLMRQLKKDHVIYAEIRFAPLLHLQKGLTPKQVVKAVDDAVDEGIRETGVEAGVILCTLRHYSAQQSMVTVKLAEQFKGTHIVGFDIAADEAGFPITNHIKAFEYAHQKGIACTAHAGEARGAESVRETLKYFRPARIGHGVRSIEDSALIADLKQHDIHLELCTTSNIQTAIYETIYDHPIDKIYRSGVSMSVNTDGRTISDVTLTSEYDQLVKVFHWNKEQFLHCNLEAIRHAFLSEERKDELRKKLVAGFKESE
jgi:adenosine deaminase